jgi:hypothetical protein
MVGALLLGASGSLAQTCPGPTTVDLITGASASDVVGVVEYEVIAGNVAGFGSSVGATKRIWGGVVADRWMVVPSGSECAETPVTEVGDRWYLLVGPSDALGGSVFGLPSSGVLSDLEAGALASIIGEPVTVEIGSLDRGMAWLRANWWLVGFGVVVLVVVVAVFHHRSSEPRRDYLF